MDLAFATISDIAPAIQRGELSPVELTRAVLAQIEQRDSRLNCFISVLADSALAQASQAELEIRQGHYRGPLHGIPVAIKDSLETAGIRSTAGSQILADYVPTEDAPAVARLREAGAIVVGKTNLHEFGMGGTSVNPHYGPTRNPWNPDCIPGGSAAAARPRRWPAACAWQRSEPMPAARCGFPRPCAAQSA